GYAYTGSTMIDTGQSTMGAGVVTRSTSLLEACQRTTVSENGDFWADGGGVVTFKSRADRYLKLAATWTLGENAAGGQAPYESGITFDDDPTRIVNDAAVTRTGGTTAYATDAASKRANFKR